jgi:hypothetical protein
LIRNFARFNKNFPDDIKEATLVNEHKFIEDTIDKKVFSGVDKNG